MNYLMLSKELRWINLIITIEKIVIESNNKQPVQVIDDTFSFYCETNKWTKRIQTIALSVCLANNLNQRFYCLIRLCLQTFWEWISCNCANRIVEATTPKNVPGNKINTFFTLKSSFLDIKFFKLSINRFFYGKVLSPSLLKKN